MTTGRRSDGKFAAGNPGRPKGARHRVTLAIEALLDGEAEKLTRKLIAVAKRGDVAALRVIFDRLVPPRKGRLVALPDLPRVVSLADVPKALEALMATVADGEITTDEAADLAAIMDRYSKAVETADLDQRLRALEEKVGTR